MRCTKARFSLSSLCPVARRRLALPALLAASLSSAACGGGGGSDAPEPLPGIRVRMIEGASNTLLTGCILTRNNAGILVEGAGLGNRVQDCRVIENGAGVMNFTGGVDFGDGPAGSTGGNAFARSTSNDFIHFTGANEILYAGRCFWDNAPPTVAVGNPAPVANTDIWVVGAGSVMSGGAQAFQPDPFDLPVGGVLANP